MYAVQNKKHGEISYQKVIDTDFNYVYKSSVEGKLSDQLRSLKIKETPEKYRKAASRKFR